MQPSEVAKSGLVKNEVDLIGRLGEMEDVVTEMLADLAATEDDASNFGLTGRPKAVYVCRTNIIDGDDRQMDDPKQPFQQRQAPAILIWRHLVEGLGVNRAEVAVYCNLKVDKGHPLPDEFVLFNVSDNDYDEFVKGEYQHIVFTKASKRAGTTPSCTSPTSTRRLVRPSRPSRSLGGCSASPDAVKYTKAADLKKAVELVTK